MNALLADFETGAILSWALPLAALLAVCIWWLLSFWRREGRR
jgi:hypothetical protein